MHGWQVISIFIFFSKYPFGGISYTLPLLRFQFFFFFFHPRATAPRSEWTRKDFWFFYFSLHLNVQVVKWMHRHVQCCIYYIHHFEFYFRFGYVIIFVLSCQLWCGCQDERSSENKTFIELVSCHNVLTERKSSNMRTGQSFT